MMLSDADFDELFPRTAKPPRRQVRARDVLRSKPGDAADTAPAQTGRGYSLLSDLVAGDDRRGTIERADDPMRGDRMADA